MSQTKTLSSQIPIEGATLIFRNFTGAGGRFNQEGDRNFNVILPPAVEQQLVAEGWNVRYLNPRDEDDTPTPVLKVKVAFGNYPPKIVLIGAGNVHTLLDETTVGTLDWSELSNVDLIISPYSWEVSGKSGVSAYLKTLYATMAEDVFAEKYATPTVKQTEEDPLG